MKITQNVATIAVPALLTRWPEKRREDACALRKSRGCWTKQGGAHYPFRTKCFGVRCVFASLFGLVLISSTTFAQTPTPTATASPSPTATECPRPTPGTCVSYEAESDNNTLTGSAFVLSCPTCSGGEKVGYVGNNSGTLQFNAIGIVVPGRHSVTISYTNGDAVRYALLSVNGNQGFPLTFPSTGSFQTVGSIQTTVVLNTGCNTLEFYNPIVGSWAPDFDQIQFNCPTSYLGNISTRSFVQTGNDVMIGGFMVHGNQPKNVIFALLARSSASLAFRILWLIRHWNCTMATGL